MRLAVNPTRMELLRLRKRLLVAQRGHKLLKDKLDGLMKEFMNLVKEYKEYRLAVDAELPNVLKLFVLAEVTSSRLITEDALEHSRQELKIEKKTRRIMSVLIPRLEVSFGESAGGYSLIHTSSELDRAIAQLKAFLPKLLKMAELEAAVRLLSAEIEKTRRRVNALEHTFIPRMIETIKYIKNKLDEMERSNTSRLMKIKAQRLAQETY
ncbi:MAG: V-type ATP synthase subunit D [Candidatus Hydrogenedentes bacterium]|nr:V-type ATP synthase subunit D [Candidatus Hydrogenedentota bacterium]